MAEEKRRRGRPPKKPNGKTAVSNEGTKQITMSGNSNGNINGTSNASDENITLNAVQQRWAGIFSKFANMGFDSISNAWGKSWNALNNPFLQNSRIKQINARPIKLSQDDLDNALKDPENNELTLTNVSMGLYYANYVYNILVKLSRDTPVYNYFVTPQYMTSKEMSSEAFKKESQKVDKIMKKFDPKLTFKTISTQVNLEGKSSYLVRTSYDKGSNNDINFFLLQKLNSDMVKLTGFGSEQQFIASFNMMIFLQPAYDVSQYPKFIRDVWEDMHTNKIITIDEKGKEKFNPRPELPKGHELEWNGKYYMYWVKLPQELCYTFYTDGAHPMVFPDTIGLFADLNELGDYKWLQANLLSKGVNSVLTAEVPLTKDPKAGSDSTVITPDTILGYTDFFQNNISGNIFPFFAPFQKFELHTLQNQPESMDIIFDRMRDLIATSGNSALMSITDKPSIASVKAAQAIQASRCDYLTRQFERFLDNVINREFELKYQWKINLWGDIFNAREDMKNMKELILSGVSGLLPKLLSGYGMTLEDYSGSVAYMKALNVEVEKNEKALAQNTSSSSNTSGTKNPVGRPKLNDDDVVNDNTGTSSDMGNNVSDIKEFSTTLNLSNNSDSRVCHNCGKDLEPEEEFICDECLEQMYDERLENLQK